MREHKQGKTRGESTPQELEIIVSLKNLNKSLFKMLKRKKNSGIIRGK